MVNPSQRRVVWVRLRRLIAVCLTVTAVVSGQGCGGSTGPSSPLAGSWSGVVLGGAVDFSLSVDANGGVSGSGQATISGTVHHLSLVGTFHDPNFSLTMTPTGIIPVGYIGEVDGAELRGTLGGSGFNNDSLVMTRPH